MHTCRPCPMLCGQHLCKACEGGELTLAPSPFLILIRAFSSLMPSVLLVKILRLCGNSCIGTPL